MFKGYDLLNLVDNLEGRRKENKKWYNYSDIASLSAYYVSFAGAVDTVMWDSAHLLCVTKEDTMIRKELAQ